MKFFLWVNKNWPELYIGLLGIAIVAGMYAAIHS